jgi:CheY-like chemotaxis protein
MGSAVLVVDDDPFVLMLAAEMVSDAGYEAVEATNADEAIRILELRADIVIVFTDVDMPGSMDGLRLARAVRDRWPPIKIIVTSGYTTVSPKDLPEGGLFFRKPYLSRDIEQALHKLAA